MIPLGAKPGRRGAREMDQAKSQSISCRPEFQWPAEGNARIPYRVFSDPEIYREELTRIFLGPTWQFLTLANQLPGPGDFLTTFLGETPVIVTRGHDGQIHAMLNRCASREPRLPQTARPR